MPQNNQLPKNKPQSLSRCPTARGDINATAKRGSLSIVGSLFQKFFIKNFFTEKNFREKFFLVFSFKNFSEIFFQEAGFSLSNFKKKFLPGVHIFKFFEKKISEIFQGALQGSLLSSGFFFQIFFQIFFQEGGSHFQRFSKKISPEIFLWFSFSKIFSKNFFSVHTLRFFPKKFSWFLTFKNFFFLKFFRNFFAVVRCWLSL